MMNANCIILCIHMSYFRDKIFRWWLSDQTSKNMSAWWNKSRGKEKLNTASVLVLISRTFAVYILSFEKFDVTV